MSLDTIINATPYVYERGTEDLSTRVVNPEPIPQPQHLPKFYLFTEKGPTEPQLVVGPARDLLFGSKSFDQTSAYFNHQTLFSNLVNAEGNAAMIQRLVPSMTNPQANFTLYLEVVAESALPLYQRNVDGSYVTPLTQDGTNTVDGYKIRWVKESYTTQTAMDDTANNGWGSVGTKTGTLTGTGGATSTMYPILQFRAPSKGAYGNNVGVRLNAGKSGDISDDFINKGKIFPYYITYVERPDTNSTGVVKNSLFGETRTLFSLKKNGQDPTTEANVDLAQVFPDNYQNPDNPNLPLSYSDFDDVFIYYDNIETVLGLLKAKEDAYIATNSSWATFVDFTSSADDLHMLNIITGKSFNKNAPYQAIFMETGGQTLGPVTDIYMENGSDGTLSNSNYETLFIAEMDKYADPDSEVQDTAINVESIIYDSGFSLNAKKAMAKFISQRKDTFVVFSTYDGSEPPPTVSQEKATAVAINTAARLYPDSAYFGTKTFRYVVIGQSGKLINSNYTKRVPLSAEFAIKSARYMGAGNAQWKNGFRFDNAPNNIVENLNEIEPKFLSVTNRFIHWSNQILWVQPFDRRQYFFPASQTGYENETSVLNGYFTAMAIAYLDKVAWNAWRQYTGTQSLSDAQLAERVTEYITRNTQNSFDGMFVVVPEVTFTEADKQRGYSWTLTIKLYAPNMKTVQTVVIEAYRLSDLGQP